jgi:hypothetical protein
VTARITTSRTMTVQSSHLSVGDLRAFIEGQPDDTTVRVTASGGGNQLDPSTTTLSVTESPQAQVASPEFHHHKPVQHRDGKPPWCNHCGLTSDGKPPVSRF